MSTNHGEEFTMGDSNMVVLIHPLFTRPSNGYEADVWFVTCLERRRKLVSEPIPASPYYQIQV